MPLFLISPRPRRPCPGTGAPPKYQTNLVPFSDTHGNHQTQVGAISLWLRLAALWDRRFRLSTRRSKRFFHTFSLSRIGWRLSHADIVPHHRSQCSGNTEI